MCLSAPGSQPLCVIPASRRCCRTLRSFPALKPSWAFTGHSQPCLSRTINPTHVYRRKAGKSRNQRAPLPARGAGRAVSWGNTATSRERGGGTRLSKSLFLLGCSSFPNQASAEPCRAQQTLLRGVPLGRAPYLLGQPQNFRFFQVYKASLYPLTLCFPRSWGSSRWVGGPWPRRTGSWSRG